MQRVEYLKISLDEARFDKGNIPSDVQKLLNCVRDFFGEIAKWRFELDNLDKDIASEKEFLELIRNLESAQSNQESLEKNENEFSTCFELAKRDFIEIINSANRNKVVESVVPFEILKLFEKERSFRVDKTIKLEFHQNSEPILFTREAYLRIVEVLSNDFKFGEFLIRCTVSKIDKDSMTIHLLFPNGKRLVGAISHRHLEVLINGKKGNEIKLNVMVEGSGMYNADGELIRVESIKEITPFDLSDVLTRLDEFRDLKKGWLDGEEGVPPSFEGLDWLSSLIKNKFLSDVPLPYTYPKPDGGIQLEWSFPNSIDADLEVDLISHTGLWTNYDMSNNCNPTTQKLALDENNDWTWLIEKIKSLSEVRV